DFARLTMKRKLTVRFIEYMPLGDAALIANGNPFRSLQHDDGRVTFETARDGGMQGHRHEAPMRVDESEIGPAGGCGAQDRGDVFLIEAEARRSIEAELGRLEPIDRSLEPGVGPAVVYALATHNPAGRIGFISAMSAPFCS